MARVTLWVPDELEAAVRGDLDGLNWSAVLQEGLRARLGCRHDTVVCSWCAEPIDRLALADAAKGSLFLDTMDRVSELVRRVGTAEGAARVALDVAQRHQVSAARDYPLPRPSRAERAAKVAALPTEADARRRHPTGRDTSPAVPTAARAAQPMEQTA